MNALFLIVRMAGETVALPATDVESVVEIETLVPVPGAAPHVAGLAALRSRVVTVIDCAAALGGAAGAPCRDAVVAVVEGHPYALLVEGVEDVAEVENGAQPLSIEASPDWRGVAGSYIEVGEKMLLVADVAALIAGPMQAAA